MPRHLIAILAAVLLLAACGEGRQGIVINGDGSVSDNSPERAKARAEELITKDLAAYKATVVIAQLPRWQTESRARAEGWYWSMVQVDVTVPGPLMEEQREDIVEIATSHMAGAVTGGDSALLVAVKGAEPAPVAATESGPAPVAAPAAEASAPVADAAPATSRSYMVQEGDTLAEISEVFYGTAQHWRAIVAANPGLEPARLVVGSRIVIPTLQP